MSEPVPPVPGAVRVSGEDMALRTHSARTKARKAALDILFTADLMQLGLDTALARADSSVRDFTVRIVTGIIEHKQAIDDRISATLAGDWTIDRMPRVDRNLARIAVWELFYTNIETNAAISEALELADSLSTDESVSYLNGLLGKIARQRSERTADE